MKPLKFRIKIKTASANYRYTGLFQSAWHALMSAVAHINEPYTVRVEVIRWKWIWTQQS